MLTKTVIGKKLDAHDSKESSRFASLLKNKWSKKWKWSLIKFSDHNYFCNQEQEMKEAL